VSKPPAPYRPIPWKPINIPGNDNVKLALAGARAVGFFARWHPAARLLISALELPLTILVNEYDYGAWTVACDVGPKADPINLGGPTACGGLFVTGGPAYHRVITGGWYDYLVETWGIPNPTPGFSNVTWSAWRSIWYGDVTPPAPADEEKVDFVPGFIGDPWYPQIAPEYTPILRPAPNAKPIPYRQIPLRPRPEFDPLTPVAPLPKPWAPSPRVPVIPWTPWYDDFIADRPRRLDDSRQTPAPIPPHEIDDAPVVIPPAGWPRLDIAPGPVPHGNGPPAVRFEPTGASPSRNKGGKEKKMRAPGLWSLVTAARLQSTTMDYKDYVNAIYQALPKGCRDKAAGRTGAADGRTTGQKRAWNKNGPSRGNTRYVPVHRKLAAIAGCIDRVNVNLAAANLAKELMEDIIGAGGDALRTGAANKTGLNKVQFDVRSPNLEPR